MQFVISFNEVDTHARFHGLRKLELDMPRTDPSYLRQRLALSLSARAGRARAVREQRPPDHQRRVLRPVHEHGTADVEFVQRLFPGQAAGDLWDGGWGMATNEETVSQPHPRLDAWKAVTTRRRWPRSPTWTRRWRNGRARR